MQLASCAYAGGGRKKLSTVVRKSIANIPSPRYTLMEDEGAEGAEGGGRGLRALRAGSCNVTCCGGRTMWFVVAGQYLVKLE